MANNTIGQAYVQIMPSADGIKGSLTNVLGGEAGAAGTAVGNKLVDTIKKIIIGAGIGKFIKASLDAGGALQQSFGGLDTIYGDASDAAKEYAKEAAKAGISMNSYAEQAVSFGASLKQAFAGDNTKAVEAANTAILDMADNSAKMGTNIQDIQHAYQGFAKQNYTMLDNLKLGYGGTKTEMERLLKDAEALTGKKYDISNLGDVYEAIHVIQGELGLTGVAAAEAEDTFTGSMQAMKAAGENLLANLALGEDIKPSLEIMATSIRSFVGNNLLPMVGNIIKGLPDIVSGVLQEVVKTVRLFVKSLFSEGEFLEDGFKNNLAGMLDAAVQVVGDLINAVVEQAPYLLEAVVQLLRGVVQTLWTYDWIGAAQGLIENLANSLSIAAQEILGTDDPGQILSMIAQGINTYLPKLLAAGAEIIKTIAAGIQSLAGQLPSLLLTIGQTAVRFLRQIDWVGLGKSLLSFIIGGLSAMQGAWFSILKSIGQTGLNLFKSIDWAGLGKAVLQFVINGIKSLGNTVLTTLKQIGQNALNAFKNLSWVKVGTDIVKGIISGIANAAGGLYNSLKNLATNALNSAKQKLEIGSPSKLFADEVGQWVPAGIAQGVKENAGIVEKAMSDLASDALSSFEDVSMVTGSAARAAAQNLATVNNVINIYAHEGMDIYALADEVSRRMALSSQQRAAVWG